MSTWPIPPSPPHTSLPVRPYLFIGREKEITAVTQMLDFSSDDTRIVSIVGGPGIGKSTLAVCAGYRMLGTGIGKSSPAIHVRYKIVVHYVDMWNVLDVQGLAEKVLKNSAKNHVAERLCEWGRGCTDKTLLILDNCDNILHKSNSEFQETITRLLDSSSNLKILTTSKEWLFQLNGFELYLLKPLTVESSCALLQKEVPKMQSTEC